MVLAETFSFLSALTVMLMQCIVGWCGEQTNRLNICWGRCCSLVAVLHYCRCNQLCTCGMSLLPNYWITELVFMCFFKDVAGQPHLNALHCWEFGRNQLDILFHWISSHPVVGRGYDLDHTPLLWLCSSQSSWNWLALVTLGGLCTDICSSRYTLWCWEPHFSIFLK